MLKLRETKGLVRGETPKIELGGENGLKSRVRCFSVQVETRDTTLFL